MTLFPLNEAKTEKLNIKGKTTITYNFDVQRSKAKTKAT